MGVHGKSPNPRRSVSVKSISSDTSLSAFGTAPSPQETAAYIAEIVGELVVMAKGANLVFVAHLPAMAQAEAEHVADSVI